MKKTIEMVLVGPFGAAGKWPHTNDVDFSELNASRVVWELKYDDCDITVITRIWHPFQAFLVAGVQLGRVFPYRDNAVSPGDAVEKATVAAFEAMAADGVQACLWQYPWHGYNETTRCLRRVFKHSAVVTMNDCPDTTPRETGRIAHNFNSVIHGNLTWNYEGESTAVMFKRLGADSTYYYTQPTTPGLADAVGQLDLSSRIARLRHGKYSFDTVFVGTYMGPQRAAMNLPEFTGQLAISGIRHRLYGWNMRDGDLLPKGIDVAAWGAPVAALYSDSFSVLNVGHIGLMGMRPHDAWATGTLLIQHGFVNEMSMIGVIPNTHYAEYDGTAAGLINTIRYYQSHLDEAEAIIRTAWAKEQELQARYNLKATIARMLVDNWHKWE